MHYKIIDFISRIANQELKNTESTDILYPTARDMDFL